MHIAIKHGIYGYIEDCRTPFEHTIKIAHQTQRQLKRSVRRRGEENRRGEEEKEEEEEEGRASERES